MKNEVINGLLGSAMEDKSSPSTTFSSPCRGSDMATILQISLRHQECEY